MANQTEDFKMQSANRNFVSKEVTLTIRENLAEVISLLVNVDNKAIEDKLLLTIETNQLINFIEIEEIKKEINPIIYCSKTGQEIDYWTDEKISQLIQTIGKTRTIEIIKFKSKNQVSNSWIYSDGNALNKLSETDPVGYFVYAISKVLIEFQPFSETLTIKNSWNKEWAENERDKLLPIVYNSTNKIPLIIIIRINELMRRYLSLIQSKSAYKHLAFPETRMEYITSSITYLEEFERGLQITISNLIKYEFSRGHLKTNLSYQDVMDLKITYKGYSNFRRQKKLASMTEIEHTMYLLRDFLTDLSPVMVQIKTPEIKKPDTMFVHKGEFKLNVTIPKKKPIKLSFANILTKKG